MSSIAAWAADRDSAGLRRWLQIGLGVVWVLDAALQYQPYMFSRASSPTSSIRPDIRVIIADFLARYAVMITRISLDRRASEHP